MAGVVVVVVQIGEIGEFCSYRLISCRSLYEAIVDCFFYRIDGGNVGNFVGKIYRLMGCAFSIYLLSFRASRFA